MKALKHLMIKNLPTFSRNDLLFNAEKLGELVEKFEAKKPPKPVEKKGVEKFIEDEEDEG